MVQDLLKIGMVGYVFLKSIHILGGTRLPKLQRALVISCAIVPILFTYSSQRLFWDISLLLILAVNYFSRELQLRRREEPHSTRE